MKKIEIIVEKNDGLLWGRVTGKNWMPTPYGVTLKEVADNLKALVLDYTLHEGKSDRQWSIKDWSNVELAFKYDLVTFFETYNYLNLSALAGKIGINRTLLNQYKTGIKYPSAAQTKKIEDGIHALAEELGKVSLVA
ncbi:MAG: hypothetical protein H7257_03835 [Taibaiella sp.]|nr:hypothetical protein [Taibaiella sp.]